MNVRLIEKLRLEVMRRQEQAEMYHSLASTARKRALEIDHQVQQAIAALGSESDELVVEAIETLRRSAA